MSRAIDAAATTMLVLAVALFPLTLTQCLESCEAHHPEATTSACHHASPSGLRVGRAPIAPCAHVLEADVVAVSKGPSPVGASPVSIDDPSPDSGLSPSAIDRGSWRSPPGTSPALGVRPHALRI